ncbi:MAG: helix-turn-helix domain-containing protein, partial [Candidatus Binatia bacterium]
VDASRLIVHARRRAGLTLRSLSERASTSHSTLAAYESGQKTPRVDTLARILRAAGFEGDVVLAHRADAEHERVAKGRELEAALDLTSEFPARHRRRLGYPVFARLAR